MMTLDDAKMLLAWMRAEGVSFARVGDLALAVPTEGVAMDPVTLEADDPRVRPQHRYDDPEDDPDTFNAEKVPRFDTSEDGK